MTLKGRKVSRNLAATIKFNMIHMLSKQNFKKIDKDWGLMWV